MIHAYSCVTAVLHKKMLEVWFLLFLGLNNLWIYEDKINTGR